ncbi:MAG TPA: ABC transporter substrate-binding protein [Acidimicrobiales bacterium]|nr:ABC transporter substrate-binding protein [Acidimicrobiales bacterium]
MTKKTWARRLTVLGSAIVLSSTLALGAASTATGSTQKPAVVANSVSAAANTLNIADEWGFTWPCQFSPFNASDYYFSFGPVYEMLAYVDSINNSATTPWLATAWTWSNGNRALTFTIRNGVTWSDGQPFSAKDVVFTFDLLKKYPVLDLNADWSVLSSVTLKGTDQVVFEFKASAVSYFYYIADETPIVAEHIWSTVKNPSTYVDPHPVGTGAYVMSRCNGANIQYTKNDHYWQPGLPKIETVNFPSYLSNTPANQDLRSGADQWGSQFIPNVNKFYISANPKNYHDWFPPVYNVNIWPNLKDPLLSDLAVRQAIAYAVNRPLASRIGEYGEEPGSNQTGVVLPTFSSWYDASLAAKYGNAYAYDPSKAISVLEAAGYKRGSNGIFEKDGKQLSFTILNNGGFSDWVAAVNVIQSELKAVGIQVTPDNLTGSTFDTDLADGHFQLAYQWDTGGPTPYYELRTLLLSANSAPVGKPAASNFERYLSPSTDALFTQYAATTNAAVQHQVVDQLEQVMLSQVPVIPVTEQVDWYQYDTQNIGGWVTQSDPYAQPFQAVCPDWGVVLLHLYYK